MDNDLVLKLLREKLADLEKDYETVQQQWRNEQDGPARNKQERQLAVIGQQMDEQQRQIRSRKNELELSAAVESVQSLIDLLNNHEDDLRVVFQAYRQTRNHWGVAIRDDVTTAEGAVKELGRIPARGSYTAQDEFVARLIHDAQIPALVEGLKIWGDQYRSDVNWLELYGRLEVETEQSRQDIQPAILMKITRSDAASTQAQDDQNYYELTAWLIEDIETYKTQQTGYHALISTGSQESEPCRIEDLLARIPQVLVQFTEARNDLCANTTHYPEVHVFLPLDLMHLDVDQWCLGAMQRRGRVRCLGHDHVVVVRCGERYERNYTQRPAWLNYWQRHQSLLDSAAASVFTTGDDADLDELVDILYDAEEPDSLTVGLQVTQVPKELISLCGELLESGLPLMVWQRQALAGTPRGHDWSVALPEETTLRALPNAAKQERRSARRHSPESHYGHHLSLLWDDPKLIPPKSA